MKDKITEGSQIIKNEGLRQFTNKTLAYFIRKVEDTKFRLYFKNRVVSKNQLISDCQEREKIWYLNSEPKIIYKEKNNLTEINKYLYDYQPDRPFVCEVPSCTLVGPSAVGFDNDRNLILETVGGNFDTFIGRRSDFLGKKQITSISAVDKISRSKTTIPSNKAVFPLIPFYNQYYYHWILLYLTKIRSLFHYEQETGNEPVILVQRQPPTFVTESLALLGIDSDRIIEWHGDRLDVETLIVTNYRIHSSGKEIFEQSLDDYMWLREKMTSSIDKPQPFSKKIYISRQRADRGRKVENYDAVKKEIESRGFETVVMESLTMKEQIKVVSQADVIMGPHGAGLVNMIFADNPLVIELFPQNLIKPHFYMLSDLMGFSYTHLIGESTRNNNLHIDLDHMNEILDKFNI